MSEEARKTPVEARSKQRQLPLHYLPPPAANTAPLLQLELEPAAARGPTEPRPADDPAPADPPAPAENNERPRPPPRPPSPDPPSPSTFETVQATFTTRLPPHHQPGGDLTGVVPANYLPGSLRQGFTARIPADRVAGCKITLRVQLRVPPRPPPRQPTPDDEGCSDGDEEEEERDGEEDEDDPPAPTGRGAAKRRLWNVEERAEAAGLRYEKQPNDLNPAVGWPLLELGGFENMKPSYFELPERRRLFSMRFGFASWDDAMPFYDIAFARLEPKYVKTVLHPKFQYLAALWRMRTYITIEELATYFGITRQRMVSSLP